MYGVCIYIYIIIYVLQCIWYDICMAQLKYQLDYTERMVRMRNRSMFMAEYNLEFGIWADIPGMYAWKYPLEHGMSVNVVYKKR